VYRSLEEILSPVSRELVSVDQEMRKALETGNQELDERVLYAVNGGGKRIRASLVILSSGLKGTLPENISYLAAGAEMVHTATLLHDDVIDHAAMRRGRRTVSDIWGISSAILLGDFIFAKALDVAVGIDRKDLYTPLSEAAKGMVLGEFLQDKYSDISLINRDIYFDIIHRKTGGFMGACSFLGASFAGLTTDQCESLRLFGCELGSAFQIVDDILDYVSCESVTGKDQGNDYLSGKVTLPVIYAMETLESGQRKEIEKCFRDPTSEGWDVVRGYVSQSGSVNQCIHLASDLVEGAISRLAIFPASSCKKIMIDLSRFIVERVY
jgi:octaprenyl-diphosphate synthase